MAHEWKIGDWAEYEGVRYLCYRDDVFTDFVSKKGELAIVPMSKWSEVKHLASCTGWNWKPDEAKKVEPPEGYRFLEEGDTIFYGDMWFDGQWHALSSQSSRIGRVWNPRDFVPMARKTKSPVIEIKYEVPGYQPEMWSVPKDTIYAAIAAIQLALGYMPQIKTEVPQWQMMVVQDVARMKKALEELQKLGQS
jgi:hypothetical protein